MFKNNWEKTDLQVALPETIIQKVIQLAYPQKALLLCEKIAGGCANLNFKIQFKNEPYPFILRVYLRDVDAAIREQKLGALLNPEVPAPKTSYIGELAGYHFAITQFMPGITLRALLLSDFEYDMIDVMNKAGKLLSKIAAHSFSVAGFFDKNLNIIPPQSSENELNFAKFCLQSENVSLVLSKETLVNIKNAFETLSHLLPSDNASHLVHGDFDPANILVEQRDDKWEISSILDWEFAFSGSVLWDVANMLRYAHHMPSAFQEAFISGLTSNGLVLPDNWQITIYLLNLLSLLDLLKRADSATQPKKCADIRELIDYFLAIISRNVF